MPNLLEQWLRDAERILQEAPLGPKEMKTKLGIKADAIKDDEFKQLMDATADKKQLVALARYVIETDDLNAVILYAKKMAQFDPKLDPQRFPTFLKFTEHIDAKENQQGYTKTSSGGFNLDASKPDWMSPDGRYRVYDAKDIHDCIKYGQGQTFCISRTQGGNMYNHYRAGQQSKYYFVFDTKLKPTDETYITVVDAHANNHYEFTHKSNNTPTTSSKYSNNLDNFLRTKPGLEGAKDLFKPAPLTDQEKEQIQRWKDVRINGTFLTLSREDKLAYIQYGERNRVRPNELAQLDKDLQNEFINNGHHVGEAEFEALGPQGKTRTILDKLKNRLYFDSDPEFEFIANNPERFPLTLDGPNETTPTIHRNLVLNILLDAPEPSKILQRFKPEQWVQVFRNEPRRLFTVVSRTRKLQDFYDYLGKDVILKLVDNATGDIGVGEWLQSIERKNTKVDMLSLPGIPWQGIAEHQNLSDALRVSPIAFTFLKKLLANSSIEWNEVEYDLTHDDRTGMGLINICATSNNPLSLAKKINLGEKLVDVRWIPLVLIRVLENPELTQYLVSCHKLDRSTVFNTLLDKLPEEQVQKWGQAVEAMVEKVAERHRGQLSEAQINRFKKLLNF